MPLLDGLPVDDLRAAVRRSLDLLGPRALPLARRWSATAAHPVRWSACTLLAEHGDEADAPALITAWDWLDSRPDDLCGYDDLAAGLARIGGEAARTAVPRLHRLWHSPHSYERAAYLRALFILDPDHVHPRLAEALWDCEPAVREFGAEHAPLTPEVNERLDFLTTDPMETDEVRTAATTRRSGSTPHPHEG
ncbi:hypothetical protein M1L60_31975 [Actinoplanes sp. TRM 88003]|uniref:HEAT repeat domain-containing protein n=1 Tax=Paractinoplanes aksuensis TaxID=2939490 RepID=A0ABT1DWG9_9ACTN|nr:hypothetical protein [Actinoplanes aksuensis]MCO8275210.1 hypothetical protein [Actinoplanes aksuensis]